MDALLSGSTLLCGRTVPSRLIFGPHETNLGHERTFSDRHVAYYAARAAGGAGIIITETASVHPSDWPYERAPLAEECGPGWQAIAEAAAPYGTVVLASLGHAGAQGSSAFSQTAMWAPSAVADVVNREMPQVMDQAEIDQLVAGFSQAARSAIRAGLAGVELDVGPYSLLRQFHSGLTNQRGDAYGEDRLLLTLQVIDAVRTVLGSTGVLALRLCADELAPWAGVTPDHAAEQVERLSEHIDLLTVVRGGPYSTSAYRPTAHQAPGFNRDLTAALHDVAASRTAVALQGSVIDVAEAEAALADGVCEFVEMTRAQIAEPRLGALVRAGTPERIRPCVLCNQACRVRDNRNPIVSCIGEPRSGYETIEVEIPELRSAELPTLETRQQRGESTSATEVLVVGGGVAGLEAARVLASYGRQVTVMERTSALGGSLVVGAVGPGQHRLAHLARWLIDECRRMGVTLVTDRSVTAEELDSWVAEGRDIVLATGSVPSPTSFAVEGDVRVLDARAALEQGVEHVTHEPILVFDPIGGPIGVALAEELAAQGRTVSLVTQDQIAGTLLSRSGDLADANTRLQRAGVKRELRALLRGVTAGEDGLAVAELEDVWTGERRRVACGTVIDASHRLPDESLTMRHPALPRAGDCVAPRTALEAILEGRRVALALAAPSSTSSTGTTQGAPISGVTR